MAKKVKNAASSRGGYRLGAGRKTGSGAYGEKTRPIRVPESLLETVYALMEGQKHPKPQQRVFKTADILLFEPKKTVVPLYANRVAAGSPALVSDDIDQQMDLNDYLVKEPNSTFLVRAEGTSMINAGIYENDLLVVDKSIKPAHGKIVIAAVNGELTVKRLSIKSSEWSLLPENPDYQPIVITDSMQFQILGVVRHVLHTL